MGCSSSSQKGHQREAEEHIRRGPSQRKRLTVNNIDELELPTADQDVSEADRALLASLSMKDILDYVTEQGVDGPSGGADSVPLGGNGRRFSLESSPQPAEVPGFTDKETNFKGSHSYISDACIGYACKKGLKPDSPNQDSFLILRLGDEHCLYGVFDGHGRFGHDVSNFIKDNFPKILFSQPDWLSDPLNAIATAFERTQYLIEKATNLSTIDAGRSGSTCSIVLHDLQTSVLYIAHVGDSRVVLAKKESNIKTGYSYTRHIDLTQDHKPNLPEERKRILEAGGMVVYDGAHSYRVFAKNKDKNGKMYPGLNMSRSLGDLAGYHEAGISATPDLAIREIRDEDDLPEPFQETDMGRCRSKASHASSDTGISQITGISDSMNHGSEGSYRQCSIDRGTDKFLLLCSDGVWEFITSGQAVKLVDEYDKSEAQVAAEHLASTAYARWIKELDGEVVDDITALVIHLAGRPGSAPRPGSEKRTSRNSSGPKEAVLSAADSAKQKQAQDSPTDWGDYPLVQESMSASQSLNSNYAVVSGPTSEAAPDIPGPKQAKDKLLLVQEMPDILPEMEDQTPPTCGLLPACLCNLRVS